MFAPISPATLDKTSLVISWVQERAIGCQQQPQVDLTHFLNCELMLSNDCQRVMKTWLILQNCDLSIAVGVPTTGNVYFAKVKDVTCETIHP